MVPLFTERTPRVVAARRLTRKQGRDKAGRFLAEGPQAVAEALASDAVVHELFVTAAAAARYDGLLSRAGDAGVPVSTLTERAAAGLSETVTPQGILALCDLITVPPADALAGRPALVAVLAGVADPGNAGTVLRAADAAGADAVLFAGDTVDPHNGKCVRASTGSLFHLPVAAAPAAETFDACRAAGLTLVGTSAAADVTVHPTAEFLTAPTAWVFGNEAHGLSAAELGALDSTVALPVYGRAESLNLAAAAAVCLYTAAFAQHPAPGSGRGGGQGHDVRR